MFCAGETTFWGSIRLEGRTFFATADETPNLLSITVFDEAIFIKVFHYKFVNFTEVLYSHKIRDIAVCIAEELMIFASVTAKALSIICLILL
ncbi:hypothetical protein T11_12399 [Trichinella zimbabwensis]|uniref:Uncharacterized protein n=1 Tax=Trichinella zimbabwensis TaxID=268475 RepID=A0A0V1HCQ5_9BILA|nr:hypothetical protein T11_12399 [Trichinella zimbabwensis]